MAVRRSSFIIVAAWLLSAAARPVAAQQAFPPVYNPDNGHWYQAVPIPGGINWPAARAAAAATSYAGYPGHLVTITSAVENQFLVAHLPLSLADHWRIGGYQDTTAPDYSEPAGGWRWITGEPWGYTNWHSGEPNNVNGNENFLEIHSDGTWNDVPIDFGIGGYIVEYEPAPPAGAAAAQLTITPNPVIGGQPAIGQVILSQPAGVGGEVVALTSSNPAAAVVPAVVTVPGGALTVTFPVTTFPVAATTPVTISAGCQFGTTSVTLLVESQPTPPATPLVLFPNPVPGGLLALGQMILAQQAGAGGVTVSLTSSNPAAAVVPAAVTVLPGASTITFPIVTFPVAAPASVLISAGGAFGSATATLQVLPLSAPLPPAPSAANLLVNGSFEEPRGDRFGVDSGVPGWRILKGTIDILTASYWQSAPDGGNQSIDLDGTSVGTIEQSFPTVPGQDYLFSGYVSHNPSVSYGRANVSLNGVFFTQLTHEISNRNADMQWQRFTYRFRATAAATTLTLSDVTGINDTQGTVLDGLSVTVAEDQNPPLVAAGAPAAPTGLTVTAVARDRVSLAWTDNSPSETAVAVWRKGGGRDWARVGALPPHTTTFTDTGLAANTAYTYRVRAIGGTVASDWSNEVTVGTTP